VDRASIGKALLARVSTGWRQFLAAAGLVAVGSAPAFAQGVEKLNVDTYAGATINSSTEGDLGAKLAMPVIGNLGAQVDLGYGTDDYVGAGGQLFLRDAKVGLFGLSGSAESLDDEVMYRLGAKTEFYLDAITLGGAAGNQWLEGSDGAYGSVDLSLYAGPNFALRGSTEFTPDLNLYRAGVEWRPGFDALPGLSIYADFEHSDDGENAGKVGMLFHFSADGVTLMDRDRKHNTRSAIFNRKVISYVS
jgi:hypothetical protein